MKIEQNKKCLNDKRPLNLFVTIDENYIPQFNVMLYSLLRNNKSEKCSTTKQKEFFNCSSYRKQLKKLALPIR